MIKGKEEIDQLSKKLANSKGNDKILLMHDHRPILIDALENARHMVIIISPWIRERSTNEEIINHIKNALQRNTKVIIGYGFPEKEYSNDKKVLDLLKSFQNEPNGKYLYLKELGDTHDKVLIKDDEFMVITSFNWLSFKGVGTRKETGYYTENKEAITKMKHELTRRLKIQF